MPIAPSSTRRPKPPKEPNMKPTAREIETDDSEYADDIDTLGEECDFDPSEYDVDESEKAASAFNIAQKKTPAVPSNPTRKPATGASVPLDLYDDDDDDDIDETPHTRLPKQKKAIPSKLKKSGSRGRFKIIAVTLAIFSVISVLGAVAWRFVLPGINVSGNNSSAVITLVAPRDFLDLGTSEVLQANLASMEYTLSSFEFPSRTIAKASGLSPMTSAVVVSNQEALDKHSGSGDQNIAAFNTPLVFVMKQQTANELKEYGVVSVDPADSSLVIDLDRLMVEVARGAPYSISGPDLLDTDAGNLLWCLMNSAMINSGLDEQVQLAVLGNIRADFGVESSSTPDVFRSLASDTNERRVIAVTESAVVLDSGTSPETWEDISQNSLVIAYPRQSAVLSFHVVTFDQNGTIWFDEIRKLSMESLFNTYGLRPSSLEAPHLGTVRLQAGLKQTVTADMVMPSVDRFNALMSMLGS